MNIDARLIDSALRGWKLNIDRIDEFFHPLSEEQLQKEIAPGRNRLIYLWGHITGFNDALFPLLGLGPKLYPDLEHMFLSNPDRAVPTIYSGKELKGISTRINNSLWGACVESNSYRPSRVTRKPFREKPFGWRWMQKRSLRLQDCLNSSDQIRILEWIIVAPTVDKERWSAVDAAASSACKIGADLGQEFTFLKSCE